MKALVPFSFTFSIGCLWWLNISALLVLAAQVDKATPASDGVLLSLQRILSNTKRIAVHVHAETGAVDHNQTLEFPLPCVYSIHDPGHSNNRKHDEEEPVILVQESTTTLLAAKALAKTVLPDPKTSYRTSTRDDNDSHNNDDDQVLDLKAWNYLDALLLTPLEVDDDNHDATFPFQSQGLLPKYWYIPTQKTQQHTPYIPGTRFPHWSLFASNENKFGPLQRSLKDDPSQLLDSSWIQSSHRLSAIPLHASLLWDMMLAVIPPQRDRTAHNEDEADDDYYNHDDDSFYDDDSWSSDHQQYTYSYNYNQNKKWWQRIGRYFNRIYAHHEYIHNVVMRGCQATDAPEGIPCYNVLHPWETLIDATSSLWEIALQPVMEVMKEQGWKIPFDIPPQVSESYDFPPNKKVYDAMIYLLTKGWNNANLAPCTNSTNNSCAEESIFKSTNSSFAMLDVGYAAILAQADSDLHQICRVLQMVLPQSFYSGSKGKRLKRQLETLEAWQQDNARILEQELWNDKYQTYLSKFYNMTSKRMEYIEATASNNLLPFWHVDATHRTDSNGDPLPMKPPILVETTGSSSSHEDKSDVVVLARDHWKALSLEFLARDKDFAFDCGEYPIWSQGCFKADNHQSIIQPIINYLVANGLLQSDGDYSDTFGEYMSTQSQKLFLLKQQHGTDHGVHELQNMTIIFGEAYRAMPPNENLATLDQCGATSTLTAAVLANLLVPDPTHNNRLPVPPLRRSWVITLITGELVLAFSIGVSCLLLSCNLVRKLNTTSDEALGGGGSWDEGYDDGYVVPASESGENNGFDRSATVYYDATSNGEPSGDSLTHNDGQEKEPLIGTSLN